MKEKQKKKKENKIQPLGRSNSSFSNFTVL